MNKCVRKKFKTAFYFLVNFSKNLNLQDQSLFFNVGAFLLNQVERVRPVVEIFENLITFIIFLDKKCH
jgi:hypothetical protein